MDLSHYANVCSAVNTATREARQANGDFGSIWTEDYSERLRDATEADAEAFGREAARLLDPDPVLVIDGKPCVLLS